MRRLKPLLLLATLAILPNTLIAQDRIDVNPAYEPLEVPPDSVGACDAPALNGATSSPKATTLTFHAAKPGHDRFVQVRDYGRGHLILYMELVGGGEGERLTMRGVVGRVDSIGVISGFIQASERNGSIEPTQPTTRPLTISEMKRIPLLVHWMQRRCGGLREGGPSQ